MSKFTLVLDSSQLSAFEDCGMLWNYKSVEKLAYPVEEEREVMNAGTLGHQMLDLYYTARASGKDFNTAFDEALSFDPDKDFRCRCGHIKKEHTTSIPEFGIGPNGCDRCNTVCKNFDPVHFELSQDLRFAVVSRLRDYLYVYQNNDFVVDNPQKVEIGFSEPIYEDSENLFVLEGRIDLCNVQLQGLPTIVDHKFQLRKRELFPKSIQFRNYDLVCKGMTNMLIINYIRLANETSKNKKDLLQRVPVSFNAMERNWWHKELVKLFFDVKRQMETGFTRNWGMCSGRYGSPCMYTPICHEISEDMRELKKKQLFVIKEEQWKPW